MVTDLAVESWNGTFHIAPFDDTASAFLRECSVVKATAQRLGSNDKTPSDKRGVSGLSLPFRASPKAERNGLDVRMARATGRPDVFGTWQAGYVLPLTFALPLKNAAPFTIVSCRRRKSLVFR